MNIFPISRFVSLFFTNITQHETVDESLLINASPVVNDVSMVDEPRIVAKQRLIIKDNRRLYDLPCLLNGPQIIIGRGKEPHIIDLRSSVMSYELRFTAGTDDTINNAEFWDCMANFFANPPVPGVFEQQRERRSVVVGLIDEINEARLYDRDDYSTLCRKAEIQREDGRWTIDMQFEEKSKEEKNVIVIKWLAKLKKENEELARRPRYWIVRLPHYDHIVYHHSFKGDLDTDYVELEEIDQLQSDIDAFNEHLQVESFCSAWRLLKPTTANDPYADGITTEVSNGDDEEEYVGAFDYEAENDFLDGLEVYADDEGVEDLYEYEEPNDEDTEGTS